MKIEKIIHLTCKDKNNINNQTWIDCYNEYKKIYSDYTIIIYDNNDIYNIIEEYYPQHINKIKKIKIGCILADIFRYLILYLKGGIYSDMDCMPLKKIDTLLDEKFTYYHGGNDNKFYIYKNNNKIINKGWDFYHNICNNHKLIQKKNTLDAYSCLGHTIPTTTSVLLCYEFHSDWLSTIKTTNNILLLKDDKWTYKNVGISQWFMIAEPKQDIFLKAFLKCIDNIDTLINLDKNNNYHYNVINNCGPLFFTKIVLDNITDKICILPSDFFCCEAWDHNVPMTKNSYIKHLFTKSWIDI